MGEGEGERKEPVQQAPPSCIIIAAASALGIEHRQSASLAATLRIELGRRPPLPCAGSDSRPTRRAVVVAGGCVVAPLLLASRFGGRREGSGAAARVRGGDTGTPLQEGGGEKEKSKASYRPYPSPSMEKDGSRHGRRRRKLSYPATKTQSPRAYGSPSRRTEWT
jgi:hypothetical protein